MGTLILLLRLLLAPPQRAAADVAEGGAGVGRPIVGDRLLLPGHFERLDRNLHLAGAAIELDHAAVDLLPDGKALGALLAPVARELGPLDEGSEVGTDDLHIDAGFLDLGHLAGHHATLLDVAGTF